MRISRSRKLDNLLKPAPLVRAEQGFVFTAFNLELRVLGLQTATQGGPWTSGVSITREPVRRGESQALPPTY